MHFEEKTLKSEDFPKILISAFQKLMKIDKSNCICMVQQKGSF